APGGDVLGQRRRAVDPRRGRRRRRGLRGRRPRAGAPAPHHPGGAGALRTGIAAAPAARRRAAAVAGPQADRAGQGPVDGETRHERARCLRRPASAGDAAEPEAGRRGAPDPVDVGAARMSGGSAGPLRSLRIGYMPLVDCAPLVVAVHLGLDRRHGLSLQLHRQASWASVRDRLLSGELDVAHALAGMAYGIDTGIGGPREPMAVLLVLNHNGQAIVLAPEPAQRLGEGATLREALDIPRRRPRLAQTFPTGTHAMSLYYWLAAQDVDPLHEVEAVTLPPPQMPAALARGELLGYSVGEPWAAQAEVQGIGARVIRSGELWPGHPEKVLTCRRA